MMSSGWERSATKNVALPTSTSKSGCAIAKLKRMNRCSDPGGKRPATFLIADQGAKTCLILRTNAPRLNRVVSSGLLADG